MSFKLPGSGSIRIDETDISLPVSLRSATNGAGVTGLTNSSVTLTYLRQGGTVTPIVASPLGAINSAHSDGGFIEASSGSMPGTYRLDVPDAAFVNGADWVVIEVHAPTTAGTKMGFTLTEDGQVRSGTAQAGAANTITLDTNASNATQAYRGMKVHVVAGTGALEQTRVITSYATSTKVATVIPSWDSNPDGNSVFIITNDLAAPYSLLSFDMGDSRIYQQGWDALRNRVEAGASRLTVYRTDDTTSSWTGDITRSTLSAINDMNPS